MVLTEVNKEEQESNVLNTIGTDVPDVTSFKKCLLNLNGKQKLKEAIKYDCYLNLQTSIEKPQDVMIKETDTCWTASELGSWVKMTDLGMGWR